MRTIAKSKKQRANSRGFTLVELLVSSAIFITVGIVIVTVLYISFRVSQRTETTLLVKNNGSNALTQMASVIRYAKSVDNILDCSVPVVQSNIAVTSSFDGGKTVLSCPAGASNTISSNSSTLINTSAVEVQSCSFTCSQTTPYDPPIITIQFDLVSLKDPQLNENPIVYPFQTSVTMRNYSP